MVHCIGLWASGCQGYAVWKKSLGVGFKEQSVLPVFAKDRWKHLSEPWWVDLKNLQ